MNEIIGTKVTDEKTLCPGCKEQQAVIVKITRADGSITKAVCCDCGCCDEIS